MNLFDPDFFEKAENIETFENLTLGKAPPLGRINHIKERQENLRTSSYDEDDGQ
ncbi:hypothetical protein [Adonisia turfae]|uniref:hypothetical protein n=1 Tax=Adonisia turfae TaxID=2950184 RepID=UPI0013D789BC|nr:hypothetical protein [Adonisia turfae]